MEVILEIGYLKDKHNEIITNDCLVKCLEDFKELNILKEDNFWRRVGKVTKVKLKDNNLIGEIELDKGIDYKDKVFNISFRANQSRLDKHILVYEEIELLAVSMTDKEEDLK